MPDTPLKRWRRQAGLTQAALAAQCGVRVNTIARWERGEQLPRGDYLETLLRVTGLPTDAVVRPTRFLVAHADFLRDYASPTLRRGRPPRPSGERR
jgi:transcriptional regulator with XRE-family HTH domain